MREKTFIISGGAGFIGSAAVRHFIAETPHRVVNVDKLTYAGNLESLVDVEDSERYRFAHGDITDADFVAEIFDLHRPDAVLHFAAESHVDRSIDGPAAFIETNILGTYTLLEAALKYWRGLDNDARASFRFLHVSTDEVFGTLGEEGYFTESTPYKPNSPYSASKAASDHLVRAWHHTYELPVLITNCSNNYGPFQFPEKLIPVVILKCLKGEKIPVYGKGENVRDWLYVYDHVRAILEVLECGRVGETYNIGGNSERKNLEVVETICDIVGEMLPESPEGGFRSLISFVTDRPGHDFRYAIDASKIRNELGWEPRENFESGMRKTVAWYLENRDWWERILTGKYRLERLGVRQR